MSGQSINDRITAARLSIAGQGLAKSVCKSTTEEVIGPKKKHLDYLLHCTNEPNVSIPQLANFLIERTNHTNWVVVFKALITVHHLMCYGNERFTQYLASSNCNFQLGGFLDKTGVQVGYDMSTYIRRYAKYLNDKAMSYRTVAFDFCKVKRGKDDGILRTMNIEKLLKTIPVLQNQIDSLLEFDCTANELTNGVINTAFMLLFRDLIRLFACYNDGIINLLEKYFDMNKKMCREALDIYKKFLIRMDRVAEFLKVAESVGIDKGDIPDLTKAPSSLLDALEQHLATLEGRKGGATTPTQSTASGRHSSVKNAVLALSNTSNAFGSAAAASAGRQTGINGEDEVLKKIAIEEEEAMLEQLRDRRLKELGTSSDGSPGSATNPFLSSPGAAEANNLFGSPPKSTTTGASSTSKAYEDLLCLANSNPFADTLAGKPLNAPPTNNFWGDQNGFSSNLSSTSFVPETSFSAVFGAAPTGQQAVGTVQTGGAYKPGFDAFGDILMPVSSTTVTSSTTTVTQPKQQSKMITGDLDSSLASLVQNLDINRSAGAMQKGGSMWNSPKNTAKTGGANWTPQVASSTGPSWNSPQHTPYQPMGQTAVTGKPADWSSGLMAGHFPQGGSQGVSAPFGNNAVPTQQFPRGFVATMGPATGLQQQRFPQPSQPQQPTLDPFGAL
ncbi:hypothetical protein CHUAL_012048 [Chamberlinius hualienensis]